MFFSETRSHTPHVGYSEVDTSSNYSYICKDSQLKKYQTLPSSPNNKTAPLRRLIAVRKYTQIF